MFDKLNKTCKHASIQANKQFTLYSIRSQSAIFCYIRDYPELIETFCNMSLLKIFLPEKVLVF